MIDLKKYKCVGMYRVLAEITDSAEGAIFLSQLMYWDKHVKNEWFYKTREEWHFETAIKRDRQISLCKQLVALGILETKIYGLPARTHYRLSRQALQQHFDAIVRPERYLRTEKNEAPAYYRKSDLGCSNSVSSDTAIPTTAQRDHVDDQLSDISPSDEINPQPVVAPPSCWGTDTGEPIAANGYSDNRVVGIPLTRQAECPQLAIREAHNWVVGRPTLYKEENTHENTHENTFVESEKPTTSQRDHHEALNGQLSTTEQPTHQTPTSGNSQQAARVGGDEPELPKKLILPEGEGEANQGGMEHHLQSMKQALVPAEGSVEDIFAHWQTLLEHPAAKLDGKRRRLINTALKMGYTADQLKQAITGCSKTPHNLGDNDRGQRYDGLHIILRDADQIDRFMQNATNPPRKLNAQEQLERDNKRIADECLRAQGLTPVGEENIINHGEL